METHNLLLGEAGAPILYVRTPLLPHEVAWKLSGPDWQVGLKELFTRDPVLRLAIRIASPTLARELTKWLADQEISSRAMRRLLAYALRASTRTTPFGLFAAISDVAIGEQTTLELKPEMHTRTRIDMGWLAELIAKWREDPQFRRRIQVTVNDAMLRRGDRYTSYHPLRTRRIAKKLLAYTPMSFRATDAVRFLEVVARSPATMNDLVERLRAEFDEPPEECFRLLDELWEAGFFVDELSIDPTAGEPSREVLARIEARDPGRTASVGSVLDAIVDLDRRPLLSRTSDDYDRIDAMQIAILPGIHNALQTDAVRRVEGTLSAGILADVRFLAHLMLRGPAMALQDYRKRFIERYEGITREVPLLELVHSSYGLGAPESPDHDPLAKDLLERQTLVACEALRDGRIEIELEGPLDSMMPPLEESRLAASFDFGFEILAASSEALQRGQYLIAPGSFTFAARAGAALGRFADALGEKAQSDLRTIASQLEALHRDVILAELVVVPGWSRGLNVSIRPVMHEHSVRVGFMNGGTAEKAIPLQDIVVGIDDAGFYLRSLSLRKRIMLTESHVLNTAGTAPTISRLLSLLAYESTVFPREYEWDCRVPFLPRVRCGRVILRRAGWRFARDVIADAASTSLDTFARRWAMPRYVELLSRDNRLMIDTASDIGAQLLLDQLLPGRQTIALEEVLCSPERAWLTAAGTDARYRAEFIASFVRSAPIKRPTPDFALVQPEQRNRAAGSDWLYIKVYGDRHDEDRLMDARIAPTLHDLVGKGALRYWYFVRYADPRSHLRIRMKIANGFLPQVSASVLSLLEGLTRDGTVDTSGIATYEREIERYGGMEGMRACERIFAADSAHVLEHVVSTLMSDLDERVAFAARSMTEMALECADVAGKRFDPRGVSLERARLGEADRQSARAIKKEVGGGRLTRPEFSTELRELASLELKGLLTRPLATIFDSLVHMHANRCGLDAVQERRARLVARDVLQSLEHNRVTR